MTRAAAPFLVSVSGPDGAGKSTLVRRLAPMLRERGLDVVTVHCYGCFLCRLRRAPVRRRDGAPDRRPGPSLLGRASLDRAHALVDTAELVLRVAVARRRVARRSRGRRPAVVVTDRGPLDALVKFDPAPGGPAARRLLRAADRCVLTLLLEAEPGELLARAPEHTAARLAEVGRRHRRWAGELAVPPVRLPSGPEPGAPAERALALVLGRVRQGGGVADRPRVVLSVFDDLGNENYRGGGAVVVGEIARALAAEFAVTVVTAGTSGSTTVHGGVTYRRIPVGRAGPRAGQLLFQAVLPLVARRVPHDLWLESFTPPFSTGFLPLFTRAPVAGIDQVRSGDAMWRKYHVPFFLVERLGLRCYRDLVALNDADAATLRRLSPRAAVEVIPNGVSRRPAGEPSRDGGFVLFLGRVDIWQKGIDLLLEAHARAAPGMPLLLAGSGTKGEEHRLDALLARWGGAGAVRRLGRVTGEEKERLLADCSFLVMPSRHETFGLVALEAMAHGKPVLHFDLPALRWARSGGGLAVPARDADALAAALRRLATDVPLRRRLGGEALTTSRAYSWPAMTDRYLALSRRLLDGGGPSPAAPSPRRKAASS